MTKFSLKRLLGLSQFWKNEREKLHRFSLENNFKELFSSTGRKSSKEIDGFQG